MSGFSSPAGQLPATLTNDNAATGKVGEYVQGDLVSGSAVSLVTATAKTVISISLTAGDWDVSGFANLTPAATTNITSADVSLSLVTNAFDFTALRWNQIVSPTASGTVFNNNFNLNTPTARFSLSTTTTVFLVVGANFTVSTLTSYGSIRARRVR